MYSATFFFYFSIPEYETQVIFAPPFPLFRHTQREPSYHEKTNSIPLYTSSIIFHMCRWYLLSHLSFKQTAQIEYDLRCLFVLQSKATAISDSYAVVWHPNMICVNLRKPLISQPENKLECKNLFSCFAVSAMVCILTICLICAAFYWKNYTAYRRRR